MNLTADFLCIKCHVNYRVSTVSFFIEMSYIPSIGNEIVNSLEDFLTGRYPN